MRPGCIDLVFEIDIGEFIGRVRHCGKSLVLNPLCTGGYGFI